LATENSGFSDLLKTVWCPICGAKLYVEDVGVDGKKVLKCSKHGEMKYFLTQDPKASAAVAKDAGVGF
jgi:hypothetical protein